MRHLLRFNESLKSNRVIEIVEFYIVIYIKMIMIYIRLIFLIFPGNEQILLSIL